MSPEAPILYGITATTLLTSGAVLVALMAGDIGLRTLIARHARRNEERAAAARDGEADPVAGGRRVRTLLAHGLRALTGPASLLLWIYGLHFALAAPIAESALDNALKTKLLGALLWLRGAGTLASVVWLMARAGRLAEDGLREFASRTARTWDDVLLPVVGRALHLMLPLIAIILAAPALEISPVLKDILQNAITVALIAVFGFLLLRLVDAVSTLVLDRYPLAVENNLQARAVRTQVTVLRKVAMVVIGLFVIASMLMVFESVRRFGTTLLASAGVAGIIIGFAAQRSIATLLAGFQIALTQPIRVDDVVIVEGEWGRIEEITLTYIVVSIWDQRRLVVPITYFIEKPFQNWTRTGSEILGTVMFYVDYGVPLQAMREEMDRILAASRLWDGRVKVLQVTEAKERTLELRALVSAADAGRAWDLRCELREKLIDWLQRTHPACLPRLRAEIVGAAPCT